MVSGLDTHQNVFKVKLPVGLAGNVFVDVFLREEHLASGDLVSGTGYSF
jgi:hypothetical protein